MAETETLTLGCSTVNPLVVWLSDLVPELPYRGNRTAPPPYKLCLFSGPKSGSTGGSVKKVNVIVLDVLPHLGFYSVVVQASCAPGPYR